MEGKERDRLINEHLSLVHGIAGQLKKSLGKTLDHEELVSYGSKGLVEAANRFDPAGGAAFSTFAYYRIRGSMLDGVRAMGWYSRSEYARYQAEQHSHEYLQAEADRAGARDSARVGQPAAESAPARDGQSPTEILGGIAESLAAVATIHLVSLEAASNVPDEKFAAADAALSDEQTSRRIRAAVTELPEQERALLTAYYFHNKTLLEAGAEMGLSKSWASRLHARAVKLLRKRLADEIDSL